MKFATFYNDISKFVQVLNAKVMAARRFSTSIYDTLEEPKKKLVLRIVEWSSVAVVGGLWIYIVEEFIRQGRNDHVTLFGIRFARGTEVYNLWLNHLILINIFAILHLTCMLTSRRNNFLRSLLGYENICQSTELPLVILKGLFYTLILESSTGVGNIQGEAGIPIVLSSIQVFLSFVITTQFVYAAIAH